MGISYARGAVIAYTDADLPVDMDSVIGCIRSVQQCESDVFVGRRCRADGRRRCSAVRTMLSWGFKGLVTLLWRLPVRDPACCLKVFTRDVAFRIAEGARANGFAFDVEVLLIAQSLGYSIRERGVNWIDKRAVKPFGLMVREVCSVLVELARLRFDVLFR